MVLASLPADVEISTGAVRALVDAFKMNRKIPSRFLVAEGIGRLGADGVVVLENDSWYPMNAYLRALARTAAEVGDSVLYNAGLVVPENAMVPPGATNIDNAMQILDAGYHLNHRRGGRPMFDPSTGVMLQGIGHYPARRIPNERKILSECDNPYPCAFDRGIITAWVRRFERSAAVTHDDTRPCRKKSGPTCTYVITW